MRAKLAVSFLAAALAGAAQPVQVLSVSAPVRTAAKRGGEAKLKLTLKLKDGYHVNSHTPNDDYLIPLRISWERGPLEPIETVFPKPRLEKYPFSAKPVSVFSGAFEVTARFRVAASAPAGIMALSGKLRYQACTETMCLPPKTIDVKAPVEVVP
jgi:hypothetical protein